MFKVLLATDGSACALAAARCVANMFQHRDDVCVENLCVEEPLLPDRELDMETVYRLKEQMAKESTDILDNTRKCLTAFGDRATVRSVEGKPADVICDIAENENFDLVVVGSCGKGLMKRLLLGSVSYKVANQAKVPVLIVKAGE